MASKKLKVMQTLNKRFYPNLPQEQIVAYKPEVTSASSEETLFTVACFLFFPVVYLVVSALSNFF
jgi:hypothetical protein